MCMVEFVSHSLMDPSHIIIWNVWGLNSTARRDLVRLMVDSARVDAVCLQETKMKNSSRRHVLSMLGSEFDNNFLVLPSVGASGGILFAWRAKLGVVEASNWIGTVFWCNSVR